MEKFETTIHVERARHKMSQTELGKKVGVSRQTIHGIESGKTVPSCHLMIKIATFFNVKVEDIIKIK